MSEININIRTDADVKEKCEALFERMGMDLSVAVNLFLRESLRVNGLPFEVPADTPNEETLSAFREGEKILADSSSKGYGSMDELRTALGL